MMRPIAFLTPYRSSLARIDRFAHILRIALLCTTAMLLSGVMTAQEVQQKSQKAAGQSPLINATATTSRGVLYNASSRKDPFLNPLIQKKQEKIEADEEESHGKPPSGIAGTYIAKAALLGTVTQSGELTAVIRGNNDRAYFLKEGDKLFDGYIKSISPESVTFVRETKMRSGKTLIQEVTKRLRTP
jgi:hypothetical protein